MPLSSVLGWARPSDGPFFLYFLSLQPLPWSGLAAFQTCVHSSSWIPLHHFPSPSFSLRAPGSGIPWLPFSWFTPSFWWNTPFSSFLRKNVLEINVWQNCMSGKVFILSSVLIGSLSGCRILGSRSFSLKIWKALLCFLLVSCVTLEDSAIVWISHPLYMTCFVSGQCASDVGVFSFIIVGTQVTLLMEQILSFNTGTFSHILFFFFSSKFPSPLFFLTSFS